MSRMEGTRLVVILLVFLMHSFQNLANIEQETGTLNVSNKLKKTTVLSTSQKQVGSKNFREKGQADFLKDYMTNFSNLGDEEHPRDNMFIRKSMNVLKVNSKKTSNSEPDTSENSPQEYAQVKEDGIKLKNKEIFSRKRRTLQTPDTTLVCQEELSCRNKCQNPRKVSYDEHLSCFCDQNCVLFKDCCADYDRFCGKNVQHATNNTALNQEDKWGCFVPTDRLKGTECIWMISSCPSSWPKNDDVFLRCVKTLPPVYRFHHPPVYTYDGRVYANRFCAQCNGIFSNETKQYSLLSIGCYFSPPYHLSVESTIAYFFSYCKKISFIYPVYWTPKKGEPRRYYILTKQAMQCDNNLYYKCKRGKKEGIVTGGGFLYRNIYCAKCDNQPQVSCGPIVTATKYDNDFDRYVEEAFTFTFDIKNDSSNNIKLIQIKNRCPPNKVFDHYLGICRDALPAVPSSSDFYEYQVVLWLNPSVIRAYADHISQKSIAGVLSVSVEQIRNMEIEYNISFTLHLQRNELLHPLLHNMLEFHSPFNITLGRTVYTVVKANKRTLSCSNRQTYNRSEYAMLQDGSRAVSIKKTGEVVQFTDYYINTTTQSPSANTSHDIFVCRQPQISKCSGMYLLVHEGQFRVLVNKSILVSVNASKQYYDRSEYTWTKKSVLVCETIRKTKVTSSDDPVLTTLTLVCMSASIIGLVFVLVTYSLFSELQTPSGINLMNLSVSILLGQLLWLLGSGQTDIPIACTNISILLHYVILVSFVWISIIVFDTWWIMSSENPVFANPAIQVARNAVLGWLPALAFISICFVLDITDTVNVGYRSKIACWINNKWAILYFLAVPVFGILTFNAVFCMLTFRAIKAMTAQARAALDRNTKYNFGIHVRIVSLMGFTWVFGFAAPFAWQFLWYPFVILNSLQGIYITMAFALNRKARGLYTRLCKGPRFRAPSNETAETSAPATTIGETVYGESSADTKL